MAALIPAIIELMFKMNRRGGGGGGRGGYGGGGYGGGKMPKPKKSEDQQSLEIAAMNVRKELTQALTEGAKLQVELDGLNEQVRASSRLAEQAARLAGED